MFGTKEKLNVVSTSDVHVNHHNTPITSTISCLKQVVPDLPSSKEIDVLAIAGDFFDVILNYPDEQVRLIEGIIRHILTVCAKYDIQIWLLEGTPSHDRGQPVKFVDLNDSYNIGADVIYADTLCIKYIEKFGINVLFVPDEWDINPDNTWQEIKDMMAKQALQKVDFAIMHGMFEFQMPDGVKLPFEPHKSERYLSIVKYYIIIGHVHNPRQFDRILVPGSLNRISHGEEEDKGFWKISVSHDGSDDSLEHVACKNTIIYKTIDCRGMDVDEALDLIKEVESSVPKQSNLRVWCDKGSPLANSLGGLTAMYPDMRWKLKLEAVKSKDDKVTNVFDTEVFKPVSINKNSVMAMLTEKMESLETDIEIIEMAKRSALSVVEGD